LEKVLASDLHASRNRLSSSFADFKIISPFCLKRKGDYGKLLKYLISVQTLQIRLNQLLGLQRQRSRTKSR